MLLLLHAAGLQAHLEAAVDAMTESELEVEDLRLKPNKSRNQRRRLNCLGLKISGIAKLKESLRAEIEDIKARLGES